MAFHHQPKIVINGLVLYLDAANPKSYPGFGNNWYDISGQSNDCSIGSTSLFTWDSSGVFNITGQTPITGNPMPTTESTSTVIFWMNTNDIQALFLKGNQNNGYYLGAYSEGNKEYYASCGTPDFYMDAEDTPNIYDYIIGTGWHMLEFKDVDFSSWTMFEFNNYGAYSFVATTYLGAIMIYNRNLTSAESLQIYNSIKSRYN